MWLENPRLLLIHGITRIRERDTVRGVLLTVHTGIFYSAAASPSWPSPLPAPAPAAAQQDQNRFPAAGTAPSLWEAITAGAQQGGSEAGCLCALQPR